MRHQFFRLFLSIVLIAFAIIFMQCMVLFAGNWHLANSWKDLVFEEFIASLRNAIGNIEDTDSVMNVMVSKATERISGILIRDAEGHYLLSLGASPAGVQMPSPEQEENVSFPIPQGRLKLSYEDSITYDERDIPAAKYILSITTLSETPLPLVVSLSEATDEKDMRVSLPSIVADQDIAGTIKIEANNETVGYIDVLVYRIDYYAPTLFATKELLLAFIISLPFALIVSVILAAVVSKKNARSVKEIQQALTHLSRGYFDVNLPKQNTEEMAEIAGSITALGKDLSRHQKSRKEWIRNISHDLNTPVTSLNILLNGAIDGVFPIDINLIESMKKENDTLMQRIQSVAYYSYLLSPDVKVNNMRVSVKSLLLEASDENNLGFSIPEADAFVTADPALVNRAIKEVLLNAEAYKSGGEISSEIEKTGNNVTIIVRNEGHLPNPLPQFFEPWARGDASRTAGGSGLGLPIVYQIMELEGGSVHIGEKDGIVSVTLALPASE